MSGVAEFHFLRGKTLDSRPCLVSIRLGTLLLHITKNIIDKNELKMSLTWYRLRQVILNKKGRRKCHIEMAIFSVSYF